jgi:hypothetical protein
MNSFLAREIVIWLVLSCIVVFIPLIIVFKKILPVFFPVINAINTSITSQFTKLSEKIASGKQLRKQKKEKKTARDEAIRVAQQAQANSNEDALKENISIGDQTIVLDTMEEDKDDDNDENSETLEEKITKTKLQEEDKASDEEPIRE